VAVAAYLGGVSHGGGSLLGHHVLGGVVLAHLSLGHASTLVLEGEFLFNRVEKSRGVE
jgi:hypothetical protein